MFLTKTKSNVMDQLCRIPGANSKLKGAALLQILTSSEEMGGNTAGTTER